MAFWNPFKPKPKPIPVITVPQTSSPKPTPAPFETHAPVNFPSGGKVTGITYTAPDTSKIKIVNPQDVISSRRGGGSSGGRTIANSNFQDTITEQLSLAEKSVSLKQQYEAKSKADAERRQKIYIQSLTSRQGSKAEIGLPSSSPMTSYEKRVGDVPFTYYQPVQGTLQTDSMGNFEDPFRKITTTPIEEQFKRDIEAGVPPGLAGKSDQLKSQVISSNVAIKVEKELQSKVNSGKLSLEEARTQAPIIYQEKLNKELSKISPSNQSIYQPIKEKQKQQRIALGKTVLSTNPLGAVILGAEATQRNELVIVDKASRGVPLYPELRQTSPEAAIYFGIGALQGGTLPGKIAKDIDKLRLKELASKRLTFVGQQSDEGITYLVGGRQTKYAKEIVKGKLPGYSSGENAFSVQGGRGSSIVELESFNLRRQGLTGDSAKLFFKEEAKIFGRGEVRPTIVKQNLGNGIIAETPSQERTVLGEFGIIRGGKPTIENIKVKPIKRAIRFPSGKIVSRGGIKVRGSIPEETITRGRFGGQVIDLGEYSVSRGGRIRSLRLREGKLSGVVRDEQVGAIRKTNNLFGLGEEDIGSIKGKRFNVEKKTPFPEFKQEVKIIPKQKPEIELLGKTALSEITPKASQSSLETPSIWAGLGLYEQTQGSLMMPRLELKQDFLVGSVGKQYDRTFIEPKIKLNFAEPEIKQEYQQPVLVNNFLEPKLNQRYAQPSLELSKATIKQVPRPQTVTPFNFQEPRIRSSFNFAGEIGGALPLGFPERKKKKVDNRPYDTFVKVDVTRGKPHWKQVGNNLPLVSALSRGGYVVDNTSSTDFRVVKSKGKTQQFVDTTWSALQNKFREYSQKSGVKVGLKPGHYREKYAYRIDTPGEKRQIPGMSRKRRKIPFRL